ncbi:MAG: flagellar biosynthesis regulator FlaF [Methyloligellaceae bacterium]
MREAVDAYSQISKASLGPRELEASILLKAAAQLQSIKDDWENNYKNLDNALYYNRRLWTILASAMADEDNQLPKPIRDNVASLGVFVMSHTLKVLAEPSPDKLTSLININKEIAAGLNSGKADDKNQNA